MLVKCSRQTKQFLSIYTTLLRLLRRRTITLHQCPIDIEESSALFFGFGREKPHPSLYIVRRSPRPARRLIALVGEVWTSGSRT